MSYENSVQRLNKWEVPNKNSIWTKMMMVVAMVVAMVVVPMGAWRLLKRNHLRCYRK